MRASPSGVGYASWVIQKRNREPGKEALMILKTYCAVDLHHSHAVIEAQSTWGGVLLQRDVPTKRG